MSKSTCSIDGCDKSHVARGFCHAHYVAARRRGELDTLPVTKRCSVDGCEIPHKARGLCYLHVRRKDSGLHDWDTRPIKKMGYPVGTRKITRNGYMTVKNIDGEWEFEHRAVMAEILGRPLVSGENVHHKNGDRLDNRPKNLELWSDRQPKGQRVVDKVEWAVEILAQYAPEMLGPEAMHLEGAVGQ